MRRIAVLTALLFAAMAAYTSPLKPSIPTIQLTFSEAAFRSVLAQWDAEGLHIFKTHFIIDFPFLLSYGWLGYLLARQTPLFSHSPPRLRSVLAWTLPVAAAADATENFLHLSFLFGHGPFGQTGHFVAGAAALTKWLLIVIFIASCAYAHHKTAS